MAAQLFAHALGNHWLIRRPDVPGDRLLAWDAADELLLDTLREQDVRPQTALVINDSFGALATALASHVAVVSWSDSVCAHLALADNLQRNALGAAVQPLPATERPPLAPLVLWRIPKSLALLEQQAARLAPRLGAATLVLAAGMDKHVPAQAVAVLQRLGDVQRLPGRKKAHVFVLAPGRDNRLPEPLHESVLLREFDLRLRGDANVFASGLLERGHIDPGARRLVACFARLPRARRIADLGCGNGVLGILAQRCLPDAAVAFFDESYQSVAAARANYEANVTAAMHPPATFACADGLETASVTTFDLILCNPPFHQGHHIGAHIAEQMFRQARRALAAGGHLWVVGNRHLDYGRRLRRLFGGAEILLADPKFNVWSARRE